MRKTGALYLSEVVTQYLNCEVFSKCRKNRQNFGFLIVFTAKQASLAKIKSENGGIESLLFPFFSPDDGESEISYNNLPTEHYFPYADAQRSH